MSNEFLFYLFISFEKHFFFFFMLEIHCNKQENEGNKELKKKERKK